MFKAVVFDLDGTLLDSRLRFDQIREQLGIPSGHYILEYLDQQELDVRQKKYSRLIEIEREAAEKSLLFTGAEEFVRNLNLKGVNTGIFTRNCRLVVDLVVEKFKLPIDKSISREEARPKPHPEGLHMFLEEWKMGPSELLYVGDSHFDLQCGKSAGVQTALIFNGANNQKRAEANYFFQNFSQLASEFFQKFDQ